MAVLITTTPPTLDTASEYRATVRRAEFEGGYAQRSRAGPANIVREISVRWDGMPAAEAATLLAFFEARGGSEAFDWTPPGEATALKFTCASWSAADTSPTAVQVQAQFRQEFDL